MVKTSKLALSVAVVTAVAFGICGLFVTFAPGPTLAFLSWVLHIDVTAVGRPVSVRNLIGGVILFAAYAGLIPGAVAAMYNRLAKQSP